MIPQLRPYQETLDTDIDAAWNAGAVNVLAVCPTGGGKTVNMAHKFRQHAGASIGIAHRQELVSQISLALARCSLRHRLIGPSALIRQCVKIHMDEVGRSFYDANARCGVAGVDTLVSRYMPRVKDNIAIPPRHEDPWLRQVTLWQTDEAHHLLSDNKWGRATLLFPSARGIGWSATPARADGYGLGRHADGVFDAMVVGPTMRWLIDHGYLTEYRIFAPPSDVDLSDVTVTASGDYSPDKLRKAVHKSHIVGDVVQHYLRLARGKLGVTFAVDVEHAVEIAAAYRAAGVPAEVITSDTPDIARAAILRRFKRREILQLVNVDLFGEGFDLPAIEVVSMARPTHSFTLYAQQFGRALRILEGKLYGIIIDHVGNVVRHGLPDRPRKWSLDRRERRSAFTAGSGADPMRICPDCTAPYSKFKIGCPFCGHIAEPAGRARPDQVDGDLIELDAAVLAMMREEVSWVDGPARIPANATPPIAGAIKRSWHERQVAQVPLRASISLWAGWQRDQGRDDHEIYRRFFYEFGTDILTAQALGRAEAEELTARISADLGTNYVITAPPIALA